MLPKIGLLTIAITPMDFTVKVLPEPVYHIDALLTLVTQTGDSLSRGWMPRAGERCGD